MTGIPEYWVWNAAKRRCHSPKDKGYKDYGGRGIRMCERWRNDFGAFMEDMGPRPSLSESNGERLTIERVDNNLGYEKSNCAWRTYFVQANNRRVNRVLEAFGRKQTVAQWCREVGLTRSAVETRIDRYGWTVERALSTPAVRKTPTMINALGKVQTPWQWAKETGLSPQLILYRVKHGWTHEAAVTTQPKAPTPSAQFKEAA